MLHAQFVWVYVYVPYRYVWVSSTYRQGDKGMNGWESSCCLYFLNIWSFVSESYLNFIAKSSVFLISKCLCVCWGWVQWWGKKMCHIVSLYGKLSVRNVSVQSHIIENGVLFWWTMTAVSNRPVIRHFCPPSHCRMIIYFIRWLEGETLNKSQDGW